MNLYNLKCFTDSARLGSMTKAAELNHLSRPAISQAIQKLEQELGVKLLVHQRRSIELTQTGLNLVNKSAALFAHVEELRLALKSSNQPLQGDFKIGSSRTLATFNLPPVMAELRVRFPSVNFKIQLANSEALIDMLSRREIDLAFFIGDESLSDFGQTVIDRGYFCLLKPKKQKAESVEYAITERRPETERLKTIFERSFSRTLPVFAEIQSWDAIWTWMENGICGGLVPDFMLEAKTTSARNFNVVLPKVFPYEIKALYPKNKSAHPIVKSFIEQFKS